MCLTEVQLSWFKVEPNLIQLRPISYLHMVEIPTDVNASHVGSNPSQHKPICLPSLTAMSAGVQILLGTHRPLSPCDSFSVPVTSAGSIWTRDGVSPCV